ncbi:unnamed protein product [Lathyrus oleraceus]|uniref:Chloroplast envelope membrane protein n=1 Tax=Pisum sativum TaxID=3888 RepID=A0A9D4YN97_PEA|nr:chloroplast envelope membrane protein [Pisum sativum]KAI5442197.1 hypothetical protein KIW84_011315 [Pisum sativum]
MSSTLVFSNNFILFKNHHRNSSLSLPPRQQRSSTLHSFTRRRLSRSFITKAQNHNSNNSRKRWWFKIFSEEDDMMEMEEDYAEQQELSEDEKFEAWKRRAEAIIDVREAQEDRRNQDHRKWEDWLLEEEEDVANSSWEGGIKDYREEIRPDSREEGIVKSVRAFIFGNDDDMLYEDRVFQYASSNSAKFLAALIIIPWAMDFLVHDYVLMPFLDRYVKTVPLAAQLLDVRKYQKLEIIEGLKIEKGRFELEVEIGKAPPLSDSEVWWELRNKALELRDKWRLENRRAFANILSDTVSGMSLFILLYFNKSKVALLKFTGYKIINNISYTEKAFVIICIADTLLGYHSEIGWRALLETIAEHYGIDPDPSGITIFVGWFPIFTDTLLKFWMYKYLPSLSPKVTRVLQKVKRH